jgi:endonuclease G
VPPMFYKIVVAEDFSATEPKVLAFLFPHQRISHGTIADFTVSIDVIEAMTGLDFLSDLDDAEENDIEDTDTWEFWTAHFQ